MNTKAHTTISLQNQTRVVDEKRKLVIYKDAVLITNSFIEGYRMVVNVRGLDLTQNAYKGKLGLFYSHNTDNKPFGGVSNMRKELQVQMRGEVLDVVYGDVEIMTDNEEGADTIELIDKGYLNSLSIGLQIKKESYVPSGESKYGMGYFDVEEASIGELSVVYSGADKHARLRLGADTPDVAIKYKDYLTTGACDDFCMEQRMEQYVANLSTQTDTQTKNSDNRDNPVEDAEPKVATDASQTKQTKSALVGGMTKKELYRDISKIFRAEYKRCLINSKPRSTSG